MLVLLCEIQKCSMTYRQSKTYNRAKYLKNLQVQSVSSRRKFETDCSGKFFRYFARGIALWSRKSAEWVIHSANSERLPNPIQRVLKLHKIGN